MTNPYHRNHFKSTIVTPASQPDGTPLKRGPADFALCVSVFRFCWQSKKGFRVVTGGTDSHIVWLDLSPKNLTGDKAEKLLEDVGIACNKNAIPYDPNPPKITSGLRIGTAAATARGFNNEDFKAVGNMIVSIIDSLLLEDSKIKEISTQTKKEVIDLCSRYPIYTEAY